MIGKFFVENAFGGPLLIVFGVLVFYLGYNTREYGFYRLPKPGNIGGLIVGILSVVMGLFVFINYLLSI